MVVVAAVGYNRFLESFGEVTWAKDGTARQSFVLSTEKQSDLENAYELGEER